MDSSLWSSPATAGDIIKSMQDSFEKITLSQYSVFIGSADTIAQTKEALKNRNPDDLKYIIFEENKCCEKGQLLFIKDKDFKKQILIKHGVLKGL